VSAGPGEEVVGEPAAVAPPLAAYLAALAVYLVLGYVFRSVVLNWIIGPLFLVVTLHVLPRLLRYRPGQAAG